MNELYRPGASVGDGGTAAILVEECNNGSATHLIKAIETVSYTHLMMMHLRRVNLTGKDLRETLQSVLELSLIHI